jgi:hypothetical protein
MWDIELNIAGYRFTHQVPDQRRRILRLAASRPAWWPSAQVRQSSRQSHAA